MLILAMSQLDFYDCITAHHKVNISFKSFLIQKINSFALLRLVGNKKEAASNYTI